MNTCIYPGSFDPVTNGHIDIIRRASKIFDEVIIGVLINSSKEPTFTIEERINLLIESTKDIQNVKVESFSGLLVDFARINQVRVIIKGLRNVGDFESEFQMAVLNKTLSQQIETMFMVTGSNYSFLSSTLLKEIASNNGKIDGLVPDCIKNQILHKLKNNSLEEI